MQGNNLGNGVYKVRIAIASKGGGKSGGGRIVTYTVKESETAWLTEVNFCDKKL